ncbi:hypothetical protein CDAR_278931 [Caerostris darwini]|uniref:Secreted protein n=1 Tax=Caerostris darwini TaxID=1538125 RepID=A0AAV4WRA7_9ARAC|nr:hypothetical protein CDAR_278931 [Caerostris darwini]
MFCIVSIIGRARDRHRVPPHSLGMCLHCARPSCLPVELHYGRSLNRQQGVGFVLKSVQRTALAISRPHRRAEGQKVTPTLNGSRHSLFLNS